MIPSSSIENLVEVTSSMDRFGWLISVVVEKRGNLTSSLGGMLSSGDGGKLCELLLADCVDEMHSPWCLGDFELLERDRARVFSPEDVSGYGVRGGRMWRLLSSLLLVPARELDRNVILGR